MSDLFRRRYTVPPVVGSHRHQLVDEDITSAAPLAVWIMCNPSLANADRSDPTATKVVSFSGILGRQLGMPLRGWAIGNVWSVVSTKVSSLGKMSEAMRRGDNPDTHLRALTELSRGGPIVFAWGSLSKLSTALRPLAIGRIREVEQLVRDAGAGDRVYCLGRTADGQPVHPLMIAYAQPFERFVGRGSAPDGPSPRPHASAGSVELRAGLDT